MPRCGTIALAGPPNAGKSTLLNTLVGERLAITSAKPQSTRQPVCGIRTERDAQIVFLDAPGVLEPRYPLQEALLAAAAKVLRQADAVLWVTSAEASGGAPREPLASLVAEKPTLVVRTRSDLVVAVRSPDTKRELQVSARTGQGIDALLAWCRAHLPRSPWRYSPDDVSTQPIRFFVAECIREAAFELLSEELPYALAVEIDEFREERDPLYIRASLYVERESQRRMVIGKGGGMIKQLGMRARRAVEPLVGRAVYLDLWVTTLPKWRSNPHALARFGLPLFTPRKP